MSEYPPTRPDPPLPPVFNDNYFYPYGGVAFAGGGGGAGPMGMQGAQGPTGEGGGIVSYNFTTVGTQSFDGSAIQSLGSYSLTGSAGKVYRYEIGGFFNLVDSPVIAAFEVILDESIIFTFPTLLGNASLQSAPYYMNGLLMCNSATVQSSFLQFSSSLVDYSSSPVDPAVPVAASPLISYKQQSNVNMTTPKTLLIQVTYQSNPPGFLVDHNLTFTFLREL